MNRFIILEVGGKLRGFKFGLYVIGQIIDELNISVDQLEVELHRNPIKTQAVLMYHAALYQAQVAKEQVDFNLFDVYTWIDAAGGLTSEVMQQFQAAFVASMVKDVPAVPVKKKQRVA